MEKIPDIFVTIKLISENLKFVLIVVFVWSGILLWILVSKDKKKKKKKKKIIHGIRSKKIFGDPRIVGFYVRHSAHEINGDMAVG